MYVGIYINNSSISSATMNQEDEILLVKDKSNIEGSFLTPFKIYIEDNFAYLGDQVGFLLANDYELKYVHNVLHYLAQINTTIYKDNTGVCWNVVSIISIFLKKLKADLQMYHEQCLQGVIVALPYPINPAIVEALKMAFSMSDIPFCGVIDICKAGLLGYNISNATLKTKFVLHYNLDLYALSIGLLAIDQENYSKTLLFKTNKKKGEYVLQKYIQHFLIKHYEHVSKREIKRSKNNHMLLQNMVNDILSKYNKESKLYFKVLCSFDDPMIELIITRAQINAIVTKYISETLSFVKENLEKTNVRIHNISEILITGTSKIFNNIQEHLKHAFGRQEIKIHNYTPDQIITKGAAIHANNSIEREISISLLTKIKQGHDLITTQPETIKTNEEEVPNQEELNSLVKTMHINVGCDV